jgi:hypothetical protein
MEAFLGKHGRSRPDRLQTLMLVFLVFGMRRHSLVPGRVD